MTDGDDRSQLSSDADDLDGLLGAYVLDALDDDERDRVEAYLATSPAARAEVDRLAASFDIAVDEDIVPLAPPSDLWDRISNSLPPRPERKVTDDATAPPSGPTAPVAPIAPVALVTGTDELAGRREAKRSRGSSNTTRIVLSVAAAVIVVLVGLAVVRQSGTSKSSSLATQIQQKADEAAKDPTSKSATLTGTSGASVKVVVDSSGRGYVTPENLPALDDGSTYQLWSVDRGTPVSLGLLGSDPGVTLVAASTDVTTMAITAEPAGGSPAPTSEILVSGQLT